MISATVAGTTETGTRFHLLRLGWLPAFHAFEREVQVKPIAGSECPLAVDVRAAG
jgi:hypothetical protein